jgi:hypothetical protein
MAGLIPSLIMLSALALGIGAYAGWRRGMPLGKLALMVVAALVMLVNLAIWTIPNERGESLVNQQVE